MSLQYYIKIILNFLFFLYIFRTKHNLKSYIKPLKELHLRSIPIFMSGVCLGSKLHAIVLWLRFLWGWPIKDAFLDNPSKLLGCWAVGLGYKYKFSFWAWPVLLGCYRLPLFKAPMWIRMVQALSPSEWALFWAVIWVGLTHCQICPIPRLYS